MPYIAPADRKRLEQEGGEAKTPGELNYLITKIIDNFLDRPDGIRYALLNEAVGALESVKLELYRRITAPTPDQEFSENGGDGNTPGDLNFLIIRLVEGYLALLQGSRSAKLNEVIGALDCAKLELYRRVAAPYEDQKIAESGDVYEVLK